MSGHSPWVRGALEDGCQHEAVFFAIGTPGGCKLLEDAVVQQPAVRVRPIDGITTQQGTRFGETEAEHGKLVSTS